MSFNVIYFKVVDKKFNVFNNLWYKLRYDCDAYQSNSQLYLFNIQLSPNAQKTQSIWFTILMLETKIILCG
jgi:hypothetical protein